MNTPLPSAIKRFRNEKDISQAELARRADLSRAYLSELEGGHGTRPSGEVLHRLATALGVTIADLLGKKVRPKPDGKLPEGLLVFAKERELPAADLQMLASIQFRGERPKSARRWSMIYDTIQASQAFDDDPA